MMAVAVCIVLGSWILGTMIKDGLEAIAKAINPD